MIRFKTARRLASLWHNGQTSALYALSSTGAISDGLLGECRRLERDIHNQLGKGYDRDDYDEVFCLLQWAEHKVGGTYLPH